MKRIAFIALCLGAFSACSAPKNPLGPSMAPTPVSYDCPSRFNFESSAQVALWQAPSWAGGFGPLSWDNSPAAHTACGTGAMTTAFSMNGTNTAVLYSVLPHGENVTGHIVVANFYFAVVPPSDLGMQIFFSDRNGNWLDPTGASHYGMKQGWNQITENFNMAGVTDVVEIIIQFTTNNGVSYAGAADQLWVDEINW